MRRASVNETAVFLRVKAFFKYFLKMYFHGEKDEKKCFL